MATRTALELESVCLPKETRLRLGVGDGDQVQVTPLPSSLERAHG
jgi:bifunctional DNA-binding transcriptional regulator/antitoxin component of YhaV-PrlF toxin-antitoxin module